jgi:hypothetical protein
MAETSAGGQPTQRALPAARGESPVVASLKVFAIQVGLAVLVVFLGSCAAGYLIVNAGGGGILASVRNVGLLLLAPIYLIQAVFWMGVYFALAWAVGMYGPKIPWALRWSAGKLATADRTIGHGAQEYVVRPVAKTVGRVVEVRALFSRFRTDAAAGATPVRRLTREVTDWPTLQHRLRGRSAPLPAQTEGASAPLPAPPQAPPRAETEGAGEPQGERGG